MFVAKLDYRSRSEYMSAESEGVTYPPELLPNYLKDYFNELGYVHLADESLPEYPEPVAMIRNSEKSFIFPILLKIAELLRGIALREDDPRAHALNSILNVDAEDTNLTILGYLMSVTETTREYIYSYLDTEEKRELMTYINDNLNKRTTSPAKIIELQNRGLRERTNNYAAIEAQLNELCGLYLCNNSIEVDGQLNPEFVNSFLELIQGLQTYEKAKAVFSLEITHRIKKELLTPLFALIGTKELVA